MKYIKEKETKKYKLSTHMKRKESSIDYLCSYQDIIDRTKYLISILGDIELDDETFMLFMMQFQSFGGRYSVRVKEETLKGMYEIIKSHEYLTKDAIEEIWFRYIRDLFEEYQLPITLDRITETFGKTDEAFNLFIDYVERKADEYQKRYDEEARKLETLEGYSDKFIEYLETLIKRKHYTYDEIKKYIPESELVEKDEEHLISLSKKTRIYIGCCLPKSYTLIEELLEGQTTDTETFHYRTSFAYQEEVTFTMSEYLESIKRRKEKIKQK